MSTWRGSCHCGAVAFEADGELEHVVVCNCSYCARVQTFDGAHWESAFLHREWR